MGTKSGGGVVRGAAELAAKRPYQIRFSWTRQPGKRTVRRKLLQTGKLGLFVSATPLTPSRRRPETNLSLGQICVAPGLLNGLAKPPTRPSSLRSAPEDVCVAQW